MGKIILEDVKNTMICLDASQEQKDSVSYLLGVNYGMMLKGQGLAESMRDVNMLELKKGLEDAINASEQKGYQDSTFIRQFEINPYEMNAIINQYLQMRHSYKAEVNSVAGRRYLNYIADQPGAEVTESGLVYVIHKEGYLDRVTMDDKVVVKYTASLIDGTVFDENDALELDVRSVISGFAEGLCLMKVGTEITLYIPYELAYGERGTGVIGPCSALIFDIELLAKQPKEIE